MSIFHKKIAPYATLLVNGIYWDSKYPRLITNEQLKDLYSKKNARLLSIADISCDLGGSLEFMSRASKIDEPWFMYDPKSGQEHQKYVVTVVLGLDGPNCE